MTFLTGPASTWLGAGALLVALTGCSSPAVRTSATGPVAVVAPSAGSPAVVAACTKLSAALPASLGPDISRRPVVGDPHRTAAWGDPAIVLTCGVGQPSQTEPPLTIDSVAWVITYLGSGQLWTTRSSGVPVSVEINNAYTAQGEIIVRLAAPLLASLPLKPAPLSG